MTPLKELTNKRPGNYSKWHRPPTLPPWCMQVDGDWFEMRKNNGENVPIACIETMEIGGLFIRTAQKDYPLWDSKRDLLTVIQNRMKIPVYIVRHTSDCHLFAIARLNINGTEALQFIFNENEYKNFLRNLK